MGRQVDATGMRPVQRHCFTGGSRLFHCTAYMTLKVILGCVTECKKCQHYILGYPFPGQKARQLSCCGSSPSGQEVRSPWSIWKSCMFVQQAQPIFIGMFIKMLYFTETIQRTWLGTSVQRRSPSPPPPAPHPYVKKESHRPFIPGCPTRLMDHVDKDSRPHVLKRTDVKVESEMRGVDH